ncbi:MAG TPA: hypothetical protein VK484_03650 [Ferruginibacter sp.]|nr:hypothetical protein [Ferruginibacter sp.]
MLLDSNGIFAWGSTAVGSDFDGSINPFPGIGTAEDLEQMAKELILSAKDFFENNQLSLSESNQLSAEEIVDRFLYGNTERFLKEFY